MRSAKENAARATRSILDGLRENTNAWKSDGRDAWAELKRLDTQRLEKNDQIQIARHLYIEIKALKPKLRAQGVSLGEFCKETGLPDEEGYSKRLYRVILPPNGDAEKRELRAVAKTYAKLISAIAKRIPESVTVLAERVLRGTSLHPMESAALDELEQLQVLLQGLVDQVDNEFGLFAKFAETARRRAEHAKDGGSLRWPQYDLDIQLGTDSCRDEARRELERAINPSFAFWPSDVIDYYREASWQVPIANKSRCRQDNEFFFLPHAYFGAIAFAHGPRGTPEWAATLKSDLNWIRSHHRSSVAWKPKDKWNTKDNCPCGQTLPGEAAWQYHAWIVIYPSPDGRKLTPTLYIPWEEEGPFLLPLDIKHLRYLRDYGVWVDPKQETGAVDRLKALLMSGEESSILNGLRRTAPWFDHNPFLAAKAKAEVERKLLNEQIQKLYNRSRPKKI